MELNGNQKYIKQKLEETNSRVFTIAGLADMTGLDPSLAREEAAKMAEGGELETVVAGSTYVFPGWKPTPGGLH